MANILLIESDPQLARLLQWILQEADHNVTTVASSDAAAELLEAGGPDIILFNSAARMEDKRMRIRSFRDAVPSARIIDLDENAHHPTHDTGADDYLDKPFHADDLLASIEKVVHKRAPQDR